MSRYADNHVKEYGLPRLRAPQPRSDGGLVRVFARSALCDEAIQDFYDSFLFVAIMCKAFCAGK